MSTRQHKVGWASQDLKLWYTQQFELGDGYWKPFGPLVTDTYSPRVTLNVEPSVPQTSRAAASSPCVSKVHRWLGARWIGYPYPLRIWEILRLGGWRAHPFAWGILTDGWPGCGCLLKPRAVQHQFRRLRRAVWRETRNLWKVARYA